MGLFGPKKGLISQAKDASFIETCLRTEMVPYLGEFNKVKAWGPSKTKVEIVGDIFKVTTKKYFFEVPLERLDAVIVPNKDSCCLYYLLIKGDTNNTTRGNTSKESPIKGATVISIEEFNQLVKEKNIGCANICNILFGSYPNNGNMCIGNISMNNKRLDITIGGKKFTGLDANSIKGILVINGKIYVATK